MVDLAPPPSAHMPEARINPLVDRATWDKQRAAAIADPGAFHGNIAIREIHWYNPDLRAWIMWSDADECWLGLDADTGAAVAVDLPPDYRPYTRAFNDDDAPFYRWFEGGLTNACFNEVDRHVMTGHGDETAFFFEGDRWDQSKNGGRGGPVVSYAVSRKKLMLETVKAALALQSVGLSKGDRIAINMPNIMEQIYYTEAAKRLGIIYTPVFGGFSDKTLSDRIHNAGARIVITSDGGYRNAQIIPYKEVYTDKALDNFIPTEMAAEIVQKTLAGVDHADVITAHVQDALKNEITGERADVMRVVGQALAGAEFAGLDSSEKSRIRTAIALALVDSPARVDRVIVVRHTRQPDLVWRERDVWSHDLTNAAVQQIIANAQTAGLNVNSEADLLALPDAEFVRAIYVSSKPVPVDAEYPLFFIYTSGSTGKPKGVVHVHGYVAGVAHTLKIAFDALPGDVIYVIADPGWITGQSYMIAATLAGRLTGVVGEGAPVFPSAGRYASIIERYGVNIFKAGATFLKSIMVDPQNVADVQQYDMSSLRVCTFCAEPTSPTVQQFAMNLMCHQYINSYWATEHGGIVWTHFYGNRDLTLKPDAHTFPLPWIMGDVWIGEGDAGGAQKYRPADLEEKGEIVITAPYPYFARTIWGDAATFGTPGWKGDFARYKATYWSKWAGTWAYTQGDFAMRYADGSFSLHGRSDDVINVSGHRIGTEEIEGAILRDKQINPDSPVGNVIVIGAPHREKGLTPVAFVMPVPGRKLTLEDQRRLTELVRTEKGATAVPSDYIEVSGFPETRSGKYMRRFLKNLAEGEPLGDTTTLKNPDMLAEIETKIGQWKRKQTQADEQRIFETYRYFRIQYNEVKPGARVATVTITNPPVNALNERALDELITVVDHLARRDDVKVVIFTGQGTKSFVAGADVKQLLDEIEDYDSALTLPNNAHLAFRKIETMQKPVIAAINGVALGGGMEFALACHYRIADETAMFGQPEINLNLLPGYGGTQRLPRLLYSYREKDSYSLVQATKFILDGRQITASAAEDMGVVDYLATDEDVLTTAAAMARTYIQTPDWFLQNDTLYRSWHSNQVSINAWEVPEVFPEVESDPEIVALLEQADSAGRGKAARRALEAMRYGWEHGFSAGLKHEAELFAQAVVDPEGGKRGIKAFLDKKSAPLPIRDNFTVVEKEGIQNEVTRQRGRRSDEGYLEGRDPLPLGAPFYPGFTPIPQYQYAAAVVKDRQTGVALHGDPIEAERLIIKPVEEVGSNDVLLYMLTSEINFNDIWALTGIPISQFDNYDVDYQITGSGGIGLVVRVGSEVKREGRVKVGDLATVFSGQSDLLHPDQGNDPMFADFHIQGYELPNGSHQQFHLVQAPQVHPKPQDLTLEAAGSYILNLGTVYRALFTTLQIEPGRTIFIEGAATGTGLDAARSSAQNGLHVTGLVSSEARAARLREAGGQGAIIRTDPRYADLWRRVPEDKAQWQAWEEAGAALLENYRVQNGGKLADYVVSHAGEHTFPRSFQLLENGGTLTFYGASTGYHFTFMGKAGVQAPRTRCSGGRNCARAKRSCSTTAHRLTRRASWTRQVWKLSRRRARHGRGSSS